MQEATEVETDRDGRAVIVNATEIPVTAEQIAGALAPQQPLIAAMVRWSNNTRPANRAGNLLDRDRFVTPGGTFDQIRLAREALKDDVVGNVAETTESLAFKRTSFFTDDADEENVWNQWAKTVNLDARLREAWRVLFTDSQFVAALWWGAKTYKVGGRTNSGNARRKQFINLQVPLGITFIDSLKVWPVGSFMFNRERLAYIASREEASAFDIALGVADPARAPINSPMQRPFRTNFEAPPDPIVVRLIESHYTPTLLERQAMAGQGISPERLYLLREDTVFRHTHTRPQYEPFARVRMESVFEVLDIKTQLRQMDRAHLIGGTNFIILVKQGTDKQPAEPEEIAHLRANVRTIASVPLIVGDHRLSIEIVTPKLDTTLDRDRYDTVDARLLARLYRMLVPTGGGAGSQDVEKLGKVIGANLMSERHMILRSLEEHIFELIYERNEQLTEPAKLRFHPSRIALEFDPDFAAFLLDLRAAREISRETVLSNVELDQAHEARMLEREAELYDDTFKTAIPFSSPALHPNNLGPGGGAGPGGGPGAGDGTGGGPGLSRTAKRQAGRRGGGTRNGGGAAPGTGQGKAPRRRRSTAAEGRAPTRAELLDEAKELGIRGRHRMPGPELEAAIDAALAGDDDDDLEDS